MVLVGDDTTPVESGLLTEPRGGVEKELGIDDWVPTIDTGQVAPVVAPLLALTTNTEDELECRVVEGEGNAADLLRLGLEVVLSLDNELLKVRARELVTLLLVKVDICDLHLCPQIAGSDTHTGTGMTDSNVRARDDNKLFELLELNIQLDTVISEGGKGEGRARSEGEVEGEGNVEVTFLTGIAHELATGVATTSEFGETTTRLTGKLLPAEEESGPELVDLLATNDELGLGQKEVSHVIAVMAPHITEFRAHRIRTVRITLNTATEFPSSTVLLTPPDVLGLLESIRLSIRRHGVVVGRQVLKKCSLIHLCTRSACCTTIHEDRELSTGSKSRTVLGFCVASNETRQLHVDVQEIYHVTDTIQKNLAFLAKIS
jgi:hypothetical protein